MNDLHYQITDWTHQMQLAEEALGKATTNEEYLTISDAWAKFEADIEHANERIKQINTQLSKLNRADEEYNNYLG